MSGGTRPGTGIEFDLARVTIEMTSPFLVGSGEGDRLHDAVFVTDANGLPTIPGESLAGILRHALADESDPENDQRCRACFGFQEGDKGQASRVAISFAQAHGADDRPVPFRGAKLVDDEVLRLLAAGVPRDHVRLGAHGAVDGRGKFDELLVPAGSRFTFEIIVDAASPARLDELLSVLSRPEVRLGASTRRGLGRFRIVRVAYRRFNLARPEDFEQFARLPVALEDGDGEVLEPHPVPTAGHSRRWVSGTLRLKATDTWLVGGTLPSGRELVQQGDQKQEWDRFPFVEGRIEWTGPENRPQEGRVVRPKNAPFVVPASAIKGALRHRTAFHARRLARVWLDPKSPAPAAPCPEETELFGEVKGEQEGRPGRVLVEDGIVPGDAPLAGFNHVCLDRFTQGPRDGLLFNELAVLGGEFASRMEVCVHGLSDRAVSAFAAALDDLCAGRLTLGAGRAHGHFQGTVEWEDGGKWIKEQRP